MASVWAKETWCASLPVGFQFPTLHGSGHHYVAHVSGGLEELTATELRNWNSDVVQLQGKVCFANDSLQLPELRNRLKSVETLGLLFWACPVPVMPNTGAEAWLLELTNLLEANILPNAAKMEKAWRRNSGFPAEKTIRFGAVVKRSGEISKKCGVTSGMMAACLGDFFNER